MNEMRAVLVALVTAAAELAIAAAPLWADELPGGALIQTASLIDPADAAPAFVVDTEWDAPLWTLQANALLLERSRPHSSPVLINGGVVEINAHDFVFNWQAGPDISLFRRLSADRALELRYFNVAPCQSTISSTVPPFFQQNPIDFTAIYETQLYNAEVNLRQASMSGDWLTWLAGFRWLAFSERLERRSTGGIQYEKYSTVNYLCGGQLGADVRLWSRGGPWSVNSIGKVGLFGNSATSRFEVVQAIPFPGSANHDAQLAFVGELGVIAAYQWNERLRLRGGYELLWIEGVAVAGDQPAALNIFSGEGINSQGGAFFHGFTGGFELIW
jgi:hypothetical protein